MGQIMRLRRIATNDHDIVDQNNGERHEAAFTTLIKDNGLLWEAELLPRSYGGNSWFGKFAPPAGKELLSSLPAIIKALIRGKVKPMGALRPHKIPSADLKSVQAIYEKIESREKRYELNLYITGEDEVPAASVASGAATTSAPGSEGATSPGDTSSRGGAPTAPRGETPSASSPSPPDPGPPSAVGPEGTSEQVGPGGNDDESADDGEQEPTEEGSNA
jgi:hypothetical protein